MVNDGLAQIELNSTVISGTNVYGADIEVGDGTIGNAELAISACSGTRVSNEYPVAYTGSPAIGNLALQMNTVTAISDSGLAVAFGKAFALAPKVFLTTGSGAQSYTNGVSAGSFILIAPAGSRTVVDYFAIGSGRI